MESFYLFLIKLRMKTSKKLIWGFDLTVYDRQIFRSTYMTDGYTLDSMAGARPQQVNFTLPWHIFTHLGFPSVHVVLGITFIIGVVMIMDYWYFIIGWRMVISFLILLTFLLDLKKKIAFKCKDVFIPYHHSRLKDNNNYIKPCDQL